MSRMDDDLNPAFVVEAAHMTIDGHYRGTCPSCTPEGCEQLDWARQTIADHRAARAKTTPTNGWPRPVAGGARRTA